MKLDNLAEEGCHDSIGTIRVSDQFGTVCIYIKIAENSWYTVYADPVSAAVLISGKPVSECVAGFGSVVYAPKSVGGQHE